jgi:hypothetical protein
VDGKTVLVMTVEKGDNPPCALKKVVQAHTTATCRLDQAVENIAWMIAHDEADYGSSEEEHQQEIQALHDYLTGRSDGTRPGTHSQGFGACEENGRPAGNGIG